MNEELEGLAFKDRKELANLNELDLLKIIEFLQIDRKEWINQYTREHNDYVILKQEKNNLKNRNNKAIEYINDLYFDFYDYECDQLIVGKYMVNDLLDILKESGE